MSNTDTTTTIKTVPTRPFGSTLDNPRLPARVPIIGLGGSSFSTFFWTAEQLKQENAAKWTPETMDKNHPICQEWIATIRYAMEDCGITLLDTAPWYGHGTSEVVIGWALEEILNTNHKLQRSQWTINTKMGRYEADPKKQFDFSRETTLASVQRSIQRLKCEYIDVLQLHDPEFAPSLTQLMEETIPALLDCRAKGYCKALGVTGYPLQTQYQILQRSMELDDSVTDGTMVWDQSLTYGHYNLVNTSLITSSGIMMMENEEETKSFADYCQSHKVAILAAAPLNMGLFTTTNELAEWHPALPPLREACQKATTICQSHDGVDITTLAIVFALANPQTIPCTILGMKNKQEVEFAAALANRFHKVQATTTTTTEEEILKVVLNEAEYKALQEIRDPIHGPFRKLWKEGNFAWDGVAEAKKFWQQVDGRSQEDWHLK